MRIRKASLIQNVVHNADEPYRLLLEVRGYQKELEVLRNELMGLSKT